MGRIRSIKGGFFKDEDIGSLRRDTRLFYIGLWTRATREGRIEERIKRLKVEIFPYDRDVGEKEIEEFLTELATYQKPQTGEPFIVRYTVENRKYIQVVKWGKHQRPHDSERPSDLPEPQTTAPERRRDGADAAPSREERGADPALVPGIGVGVVTGMGTGIITGKGADKAARPYTIRHDHLSKIIYIYKTLSGYRVRDREWDRLNWSRSSKTAKNILESFNGDFRGVVLAFKAIVQAFKTKGLSWTIETVSRWILEYRHDTKLERLYGSAKKDLKAGGAAGISNTTGVSKYDRFTKS